MWASIRFLWPYLQRHQKALALGFLALIAKDLLGVLLPLVIRRGVNALEARAPWATVAQLAALLPGIEADLPDRLCVQRKRDVIPAAAWQSAVEAALTKLCPATPWKVKIEEVPQHRFPSGEILFARSGVVASRGPVQLWRGSLVLPDKSSVPIWVKAEIKTQRHALLLQHAVAAGAVLAAGDFKEEEIWAPGLCVEETKERPSMEGLIAKKSLAAGAELLREDLRRPPAVHRGEPIEVESGSGAARIKVPAVAEKDGEIGVLLEEILNPRDPALKSGLNGELGFNAERFAPLEESTGESALTEEEEDERLLPA